MTGTCSPSTHARRALQRLVLLTLVIGVYSFVLAAAVDASGVPILAGPWSLHQKGYGHVKPAIVFNGGDPTGLVRYINWNSWGSAHAVGTGIAEYEAPNQPVAGGSQEIARIVLFQLGSCHHRRAYNAIEWYFPQHGQHFNPHQYINACTGQYYPRY